MAGEASGAAGGLPPLLWDSLTSNSTTPAARERHSSKGQAKE